MLHSPDANSRNVGFHHKVQDLVLREKPGGPSLDDLSNDIGSSCNRANGAPASAGQRALDQDRLKPVLHSPGANSRNVGFHHKVQDLVLPEKPGGPSLDDLSNDIGTAVQKIKL